MGDYAENLYVIFGKKSLKVAHSSKYVNTNRLFHLNSRDTIKRISECYAPYKKEQEKSAALQITVNFLRLQIAIFEFYIGSLCCIRRFTHSTNIFAEIQQANMQINY